MSRNQLPTQVPLPEVSRHTEDIVFGNLGLPTGFDQERLLVNLRSIDRVRGISGLAGVSIYGSREEKEVFQTQADSVDGTGGATMSLAGVSKRARKPLSRGNVRFPISSAFDFADAQIKLDVAEIEARIDEDDKYERGVFDPAAQAKFLNRSLKQGLKDASFDSAIDKDKMSASARYYGIATIATALSTRSPMIVLGAFTAVGPILKNLQCFKDNAFDSELGVKEIMQRLRQSIFVGCEIDRYIAASGVIAASKFLRAKE